MKYLTGILIGFLTYLALFSAIHQALLLESFKPIILYVIIVITAGLIGGWLYQIIHVYVNRMPLDNYSNSGHDLYDSELTKHSQDHTPDKYKFNELHLEPPTELISPNSKSQFINIINKKP